MPSSPGCIAVDLPPLCAPVGSGSRVGKTPGSPCPVQQHRDHRGDQDGAERDLGDLPAGHAAGDDRVGSGLDRRRGGSARPVRPASAHYGACFRRAEACPGDVRQLEEDGERRRGLHLPRPLGRLGDLSDHLAHGLVLRFERDIGLGHHANEPILIVDDRQPPHLMLCHQVKRV